MGPNEEEEYLYHVCSLASGTSHTDSMLFPDLRKNIEYT